MSIADQLLREALLANIEGASSPTPLSTTDEIRSRIQLDLHQLDLALKKEGLNLAVANRSLRKWIAIAVGFGLAFEIVMLFGLVSFQGIGRIPKTHASFKLEQWTFNIFTSAVLLQTFGLANLIVKNLFPEAYEASKTEKQSKKSTIAY